MAGNKVYTCTGAVLRCSFGTASGSLVATPKSVSLCGQQQANIGDHISMANIRPFGRCRTVTYPATGAATAAAHGKLTPMPCVPGTATPWSIVDANSIVCGKPAVLHTARLRCIYGGIITIVNPGQQLEKTGADKVEIKETEITPTDYSWSDGDATQSRNLCIHTPLKAGDRALVKIGDKVYPAVVDNRGIAEVRNVDVSEVRLDIADKPAPKRADKPAPSKPADTPAPPKPKETPATPKPADPGQINTITVPAAENNGWGDPVANPRIRRDSPRHLYGPVRKNADGSPRNHQGFDYYAPTGTPVLSVGDGVVHTIQHGHSSYGLNVTIRHTRGKGVVYSFYAHLSGLEGGLKVGQVVKKGEVIARAGTSGNAKGMTGLDQHLHFECRTSPGHQLNFGGKENPNAIVATKFTAESLAAGKK